jgi:hypothetical protein
MAHEPTRQVIGSIKMYQYGHLESIGFVDAWQIDALGNIWLF